MGNVWGSIRRNAVVSQLLGAAEEDDPWRNYILPVHVLGLTAVVIFYQFGMHKIRVMRHRHEELDAEVATIQACLAVVSERLGTDFAHLDAAERRDLELRAEEVLSFVPETVDFDLYERTFRSLCFCCIALILGSAGFSYLVFGRS